MQFLFANPFKTLIFNLYEDWCEVILKKRVDSLIGLTIENNYTNVLIGLD